MVVGDVHGRADLLVELIEEIENVAPNATRVFVGDYIDRGPDSLAVLDILLEQEAAGGICLKGNHEEMCLEFLSQDDPQGYRWLRHGGLETLASFDIHIGRDADFHEIANAKRMFSEKLGGPTRDWLKERPLYWKSGNIWVCHAGPSPAEPIPVQDEKHFLWGHNRFLRDVRTDGQWVVHGHWVVDKPQAFDGRINVDTGAWRSGKLTAAVISTDGNVKFLST